MIKKITLLLILSSMVSWAQVPNWVWAKSTQLYFNGEKHYSAVDSDGNIYLTTDYTAASLTIGSTTLTNTEAGYGDFAIIKYNNLGDVLWVKNFGGTRHDSVTSITTDANGNFYVAGSYQTSMTIGTATLNDPDNGSFIGKFDTNGNLVWIKDASNVNDYVTLSSILTDAAGNIYIGGTYFSPTLTLDSVVINYEDYSATNNTRRSFIAKLNASGNCIWARSSQSNTPNVFGVSMFDLDVDTQGNVYTVGNFANNVVHFGSITLTKTITSDFNSNMYIVKYDANGNALWGFSTGSQYQNNTASQTVKTDLNDNVYVSGYFTNTINVGNTTLMAAGGSQMFTIKFNSAGVVQWAKHPTSNTYDAIQSSDIDENGNLIVAGMAFSSSINFGNGVVLNSDGQGALFVAKYNPAGTAVWGRVVGNLNANNWLSIDCKTGNEIYVAGSFDKPTITFGTTTLNKQGNYDIYLAKLYAAPLGIEEYNLNNILVYPNPVNDIAFIDNIAEPYTYSLYASNGALVQKGKIQTADAVIDMKSLSSGTYYLSFFSSGGKYATKKIIKE